MSYKIEEEGIFEDTTLNKIKNSKKLVLLLVVCSILTMYYSVTLMNLLKDSILLSINIGIEKSVYVGITILIIGTLIASIKPELIKITMLSITIAGVFVFITTYILNINNGVSINNIDYIVKHVVYDLKELFDFITTIIFYMINPETAEIGIDKSIDYINSKK